MRSQVPLIGFSYLARLHPSVYLLYYTLLFPIERCSRARLTRFPVSSYNSASSIGITQSLTREKMDSFFYIIIITFFVQCYIITREKKKESCSFSFLGFDRHYQENRTNYEDFSRLSWNSVNEGPSFFILSRPFTRRLTRN